MDGQSNYRNNLYKGIIKQMQIKRSNTAPSFLETFTLGKISKYFTVCKVWVRPPTRDYPSIGIFISFNNGNSSCFSRLNGLDELNNLVSFLQECSQRVQGILPGLEQQQTIVEKANEEADQTMKLLQLAQQLQSSGDTGEVDGNDSYEELPPSDVETLLKGGK